MRKSLLGAVAVAALMLPGSALAQSGTIKIGILVALIWQASSRREQP